MIAAYSMETVEARLEGVDLGIGADCDSQAVAVTAGACYWIEIVNNTSANTWFWQDGIGGDVSALVDTFETNPPSVYDEGDRLDNDQAFCLDVAVQSCLGSPCDNATGPCCESHLTPGCKDSDCCKRVCACDSFCCSIGGNWDLACAETGANASQCGALALCGQYCADCPDDPGAIRWLDPAGDPLSAGGIVDARQAHPITDPAEAQGLDTFVAEAPIGAGGKCWSLVECDSRGGRVENDVDKVFDNGDGTHTITLQQPLTTGALTELVYTPDGADAYIGSYASLPGDADGNRIVEVADLEHLINCINGLPCALWETDINRSDAKNSQDLLRLIDLLNGADDFEVWLGQTVPAACQ